jgi:hypothetical protein
MLAHRLGLDRVAETARIGFDGFAAGSAEQTVDRDAIVASAEVPESVVYCADAHGIFAVAGERILAVHLVPKSLAGKWILAEKKAPEFSAKDGGNITVDGTVETVESRVGANAEIRGAEGKMLFRARMLLVDGRAQRVINVLPFDLVLVIDTGIDVVMAGYLDELDLIDLERAICMRQLGGRLSSAYQRGAGANGKTNEQVATIHRTSLGESCR